MFTLRKRPHGTTTPARMDSLGAFSERVDTSRQALGALSFALESKRRRIGDLADIISNGLDTQVREPLLRLEEVRDLALQVAEDAEHADPSSARIMRTELNAALAHAESALELWNAHLDEWRELIAH